MSTEVTQNFDQSVKKVDFFPFEWSPNLLAVCLSNDVKIYSFVYVQTRTDTSALERDFNGSSNHIEVRISIKHHIVSKKCLST